LVYLLYLLYLVYLLHLLYLKKRTSVSPTCYAHRLPSEWLELAHCFASRAAEAAITPTFGELADWYASRATGNKGGPPGSGARWFAGWLASQAAENKGGIAPPLSSTQAMDEVSPPRSLLLCGWLFQRSSDSSGGGGGSDGGDGDGGDGGSFGEDADEDDEWRQRYCVLELGINRVDAGVSVCSAHFSSYASDTEMAHAEHYALEQISSVWLTAKEQVQ
jgi:hypothetical protein